MDDRIRYYDRKAKQVLDEVIPFERFIRWMYYNPFGKVIRSSILKRRILSSLYGLYMKRPISYKKVEKLMSKYNYNISESEKSPEEFKSMNDLFTRKLKKGARLIDPHKSVLISPSDGKVMGFEKISHLDSFFVKGQMYNLSKFLKSKQLTQKFNGCSMLLIRLAPLDYHRFHFPVSGYVHKTRKIRGKYNSVSRIVTVRSFNYVFENKRQRTMISNPHFGDVLMVEIGAMGVGSIKQTFEPGKFYNKGDEKGYFKFGGSSIALLFDSEKIKINQDILDYTKKKLETKVFMGEEVARLR